MMKKALFLVLLAACGDNSKLTPDGHPGGGTDGTETLDPLYKAVVVGADFTSGTGVVSRLDVSTLDMQQNAVPGAATSDPVLRHIGDSLYIINRSVGENVTILDAHSLAPTGQFSTGAGSNPQDVAVVGSKLYVPAAGTAGVVVLTLPAGTTTTINLATAVGDPDGKPDCIAAAVVGTDVYVACDLLDANYAPRGVGKVAVIDTTTDTVRTTLSLPFKNPQGFFIPTPASSTFAGDLLIETVPAFDTYTMGCLARIKPGTTPTATCSVTNMALGGFITDASINDKLWLSVIVDMNFATVSGKLRSVDLSTGMLATDSVSPTTEQIGDLAACPDPDNTVVAVDSKMNAEGVRVYKGTTERTTAAVPIGLPPIFSGGIVCYDVNHP
jgi:hypothetical protein